MKAINVIFFALFWTACLSSTNSQGGYRILVEVNGLEEGDLMLGYHYGNNKYLLDTAKVVSPSRYLFQGPEKLDPGVYILVLPGNTFFDIIIDKSQSFEIATSTTDFLENTSFKDSPENTSFFKYLSQITGYRQEISSNNAELQDEGTTESRREELISRKAVIDSKILSSQDSYIQQFPDGLFSTILIAQREPLLNDPPAALHEEEIRQYNYNQYKNRFWENFDFSDQRLLRSPVYFGRLNQFFGEVLVQAPDTLIIEADQMVNRARKNQDVFRYTVWFITNHFERSQIMGHDAVFVHMLEKYYLTDEAFWVTEESRASLAERVSKMKPLLIGKVAPDINVFYADRQPMALHQVESNYTILYFWDSNCGHCKRETPRVDGIYNRFLDNGVKVFALNLDGDPQSWQKAIEEYQIGHWINVTDPHNESGFREKFDVYATPIIYLLDHEKRILAKRIDAQVLELFMEKEISHKNGL